MDNNNYIIAGINIEKEDLNKNIRIISSFEGKNKKVKERKYKKKHKNYYLYANEKEIKKCEIKINEELIPFCYSYKFNQKGKYKIK